MERNHLPVLLANTSTTGTLQCFSNSSSIAGCEALLYCSLEAVLQQLPAASITQTTEYPNFNLFDCTRLSCRLERFARCWCSHVSKQTCSSCVTQSSRGLSWSTGTASSLGR